VVTENRNEGGDQTRVGGHRPSREGSSTTMSTGNAAKVLVRLSPDDIRTIRTALSEFLQIQGREEGHRSVRGALPEFSPDANLAQAEVDDQLHALACACRKAGVCGEETPAEVTHRAQLASVPAADVAGACRQSTARVTLPIIGLACGGGGALTLERVLQRMAGVVRAYVNPATEMAYIEYDPDRIDLPALKSLIESAGYRTALPGNRP